MKHKLQHHKLFYELSGKKVSSRRVKREFWSDTLRGCYSLVAKLIAWILRNSKKALIWSFFAFKNDWQDTKKRYNKRRSACPKNPRKFRALKSCSAALKRGFSNKKVDWKWVLIAFLIAWILAPTAKKLIPSEPQINYYKPKQISHIQAPQLTEKPQAVPETTPEPKVVTAPVYNAPDCNGYGGAAAELIRLESGCNPNAVNRSSGACGIAQELPCGKSGCALGDGVCQLAWMERYVMARYGSWEAALSFHYANNYY